MQNLRLDEVALDALTAQTLPEMRPSDVYLALEVIPGDADEEVAMTMRFVKDMPYERIELGAASSSSRLPRARRTTFAKTVRTDTHPHLAATLSFDKVWFDQSENSIAASEVAALDDAAILRRSNSWLWLGVSLLAAAIAVGVLQYSL